MIARGHVAGTRGGLLHVAIPAARIGQRVTIAASSGAIGATVVALADAAATVAPHAAIDGCARGDRVAGEGRDTATLGMALLGRAIDGACRPLDGGPPPRGPRGPVDRCAPAPHERVPIAEPCPTGMRAIDGLLAFGRGARIGFFGPPGSGKSTLLESLASQCEADALVVGAIGERGREAHRWIAGCDRRTTVVCATSDASAAQRVRAARLAFAQAAALRDRGLHVCLILDSLARVAGALREVALACGEPAGRGGYPPSVFAGLAGLVEIAGATRAGSITLLASVLSDGDERDPVSDAARSLLDGHVQLSAELASAGRFPAIDLLASASRTAALVLDPAQRRQAASVRAAMARLAACAEARSIGFEPSLEADRRAVALEPALEAFLRQGEGPEPRASTLAMLAELADTLGDTYGNQ